LPDSQHARVEPISRKVGSWERRGVIDILIPGQAAVYRVPQQELDVLATARIDQVPLHERAQAQTLMKLAHENQ
jgi:hypothetical protein